MIQSSPEALSSLTPSFNSYSSRPLTEIASRVVEEFRVESADEYEYLDEYGGSLSENRGSDFRVVEKGENNQDGAEDDDDEEEFEFAVFGRDFDLTPSPADEIFYNGQIRPYFPVFNTDLVFGSLESENLNCEETHHAAEARPPPPSKPSRLPLRKLFMEDREHGSSWSCSSSEAADDLDGVSPDSYCMWTPDLAAEQRRKKSNSTGSSKRWRLRDLRRTFSNDRGNFVLLTHLNHQNEDVKKREEKLLKNEKIFCRGSGDFHSHRGGFCEERR